MSNNILAVLGTPIKWKSSGGDGTIDMTSKATNAGRLGSRVDLGAFPRAAEFRVFCTGKFVSGLTLYGTLDIYFAGWNDDATPANPDAGVGASDADFNTESRTSNLKYVGSLIVDQTNNPSIFARSFSGVYLPYRYVSPVVFNKTGASHDADPTQFQLWLTPVNPQVQ
jgi:hypothetical protein